MKSIIAAVITLVAAAAIAAEGTPAAAPASPNTAAAAAKGTASNDNMAVDHKADKAAHAQMAKADCKGKDKGSKECKAEKATK